MLPSDYELFVKYAVGVSLLVAVISLWRLPKRGVTGLFMVAASLAFAVFLYLLLIHATSMWLYAAGAILVFCLLADAMSRPKPEKR